MNPEQIKTLEDYAEWRERAFEEGADASVPAYVEYRDTLAEERDIEMASEAFGGLVTIDWKHAEEWEKKQVRNGMRKALAAIKRH